MEVKYALLVALKQHSPARAMLAKNVDMEAAVAAAESAMMEENDVDDQVAVAAAESRQIREVRRCATLGLCVLRTTKGRG